MNAKDVLTEFRETGEVTPMRVFADWLDDYYPHSPGSWARFFRGLAAAATEGREDERPDFQFWAKAVLLTGGPNWMPRERFIENAHMESACRLAIAEAYGRRMIKFGQWRMGRFPLAACTSFHLDAREGTGDHDWTTLEGRNLHGGLPHVISDNFQKMGLEQRLAETRLFMASMAQPMPEWLTGVGVSREPTVFRWDEGSPVAVLPAVPYATKAPNYRAEIYCLAYSNRDNKWIRAFNMNHLRLTIAMNHIFDTWVKWRLKSLMAQDGIVAEPVTRVSAKMHRIRKERFLELERSKPLTGGVT